MKKMYLFVFSLFTVALASAQCTVDVNNNVQGITPPDSVFPAIIQGQTLDNSYVAQIHVPTTSNLGIQATVYWIAIFNITGLPSGITYTKNPVLDTIYGGNNACVQLHGVTNDVEGEYPLNFVGAVKVNTSFTGDTIIPLAMLNLLAAQSGAEGFGYKVRVVDPTGVNTINEQLATALQVMPNPSHGRFDVKLDMYEKVEGELSVLDITGKTVYSQAINTIGAYTTNIDLGGVAKGMYVVQLKTTKGLASKKLSIE
ncbi:MAG: T9SS type A sorting domain-containing protein [Bacteroidetes bacterium]|nr:T9SS type A sorting domain-containing protein [Bacteroidota bacterium]